MILHLPLFKYYLDWKNENVIITLTHENLFRHKRWIIYGKIAAQVGEGRYLSELSIRDAGEQLQISKRAVE